MKQCETIGMLNGSVDVKPDMAVAVGGPEVVATSAASGGACAAVRVVVTVRVYLRWRPRSAVGSFINTWFEPGMA